VSRNDPGSTRPVGTHFDGDLRAVLVDAAVAAVAELGADAVSLRDIARRAGVSHAAPAHHFGDKAGLLTVAATHGFRRFAAALEAVPTHEEPITQMAALARAYAAFAEAERGSFEIMFRPALLRPADPDLMAAAESAIAVLRRHVERCQEAGWRSGVDVTQLTATAWAFAHGVASLRNQGALAPVLDLPLDVVEQMTEALLTPDPTT